MHHRCLSHVLNCDWDSITNGSIIHYAYYRARVIEKDGEEWGQKGVRKTEMMAEKWGCNKIRRLENAPRSRVHQPQISSQQARKTVYLKSIQENFLVHSNVVNSLTRQKLLPIVYNVEWATIDILWENEEVVWIQKW